MGRGLNLTFTKDGSSLSLNGGSYLKAKSFSATGIVTVSTSNAADYIEILGDLNLSNKITLNTAVGTISVGGNYTYSWADETKVKKTTMHFDGTGVQKLEVGGVDFDLDIQFIPNDNFGFGQLIVGQCDQPTLVQLVEEVNNGNRASSNPEALYLFGTPADPNCGLRILGGSTLMLGNLNVYAMIDGTMTRIRDLFGAGQTLLHFTQNDSDGYIMLGNPEITNTFNLIINGGFESGINLPDATTLSQTLAATSGDLTGWTISGDGIDWCHDALFKDADTTGVLSAELSPTAAGAGVISQTFTTTPGKRYFVWFNLGFNPLGNPAGQAGDKKVEVRAADQTKVFTINSTIASGSWPTNPAKGWTITWQPKTWSFVANDATTTLEFACVDNPATAYGAAIDNVVVIEGSKVLSLLSGDLDHNYVVSLPDLILFAGVWLNQNCDSLENCWCGGADIDHDGDVDLEDFALLADNWLTAAFGTTYTIAASSTVGGTITQPGIGLFNYSEVTSIPITVQSDAHYHFTGWTGTAADAGKVADANSLTTTLLVDNSHTLQANFSIDRQILTISSGPNGTVTLPGTGDYEYDYGTVVNVNAAANTHYHFVAWTGTAVEAGKVANPNSPATTVTMDGNYTLIAAFTSDQYTLTTSVGDGGSITTPGQGDFAYNYGSLAFVTAQPNNRYVFSGWTGTAVDAGKVTNPASASTTVLMDSNYTLKANFTLITYTLTISTSPGGNVIAPGIGNFVYNSGEQVTVTAQAAAHYHFTGWSGSAVSAGKVATPSAATTTVQMDGNYTLQANFAIDQTCLTISTSTGGSVINPGQGTLCYNYGSTVSITAKPNDFYHFVGWTGSAVTAGKVANPNAASTTVTVDADYTLQAEFAQNQIETIIENGLDLNPGWAATGQWSFGIPAGQGGTLFGEPDPTGGYTGQNVYGVNLNGDYDIEIGGPYYMTAGPFNLTGYYETVLQFASWLNSDNADYVVHSVQLSTNGSNWATVWQQSDRDEIVSSDWSIKSYNIGSLADNAGSVYVRWGYQIVGDRTYPYSGWNIDDIKLDGRKK